ncbi:M20 aminoacylase family protein [Thiomonas sp. FB-Cd]|uniref:M20 aminoacylase family protein n=1 Tax=Thiomonas sp. FB-Cd TaxID=1158292 RepID=UPI0004DEE634|nr:M20 aminoacylase family protein [Thiomonas sp. FB-Cd]
MSDVLNALLERPGNFAEFVELRRDIHRHPELAFAEHRTSALVAERLRQWGYEVETGVGKTGVVARLQLGKGVRRLGIRADMDALPIQEGTGKSYASCHKGVMHACGHDGHTAMLLAAAHHVAQRGLIDGTLHLIFQPAEEGGAGARRMIADGLFDRYPCDAIFAMHNMPGISRGHLVLRDGASMASSDYATVTLTGIGGHGAMPHHARDPVVAASSIVMALQTIVARNVDPLAMAVITVGALHAGRANNVIAQDSVMEISVRSLDHQVRELLRRRLHELVQAQAQSFGVEAHIDWREGYSVLVNDVAQTDFARQIAIELLGSANVTLQGPALTGSEDFAFMLEKIPGSYVLIGNGDESGAAPVCMVHNRGYDFNDDILPVGAAFWTHLAERFLVQHSP